MEYLTEVVKSHKVESINPNADCANCRRRNFLSKFGMISAKSHTMSVLFLVTIFVSVCSAQNLKIDIGDTLRQQDLRKGTVEFQAPVALQWGIADTSSNVGKMFKFAIPDDAFRGTIHTMKVTEAGKLTLPSWLVFDEESRQLSGVPSPSNIGDNYLEVVTTGPQNSQAKDVFSIKVVVESPPNHVPPPTKSSDGKPQTVRCKREQPETSATIVVDADMMTMPPSDRINLMNMLSDHLNLASDMMKMLPLGDKEVFDKSALVAGQGDSKDLSTPGMMMSWLVGCGSVQKDHMNVLQKVESSAASGKMKQSVGHKIIGWHVINTAIQEKPKRRRRAIMATATVIDTPSPPTKLPDTVVTDIKPSVSTAHLTRSVPVMETSYTKVEPTKTMIMPSASPTMEVKPTDMMTKTTTTSTPKPAVVTSAPITPSPSPSPPVDKSEIMPTKSMTVTDAPTKVTPQPEPEDPNCPNDGKSRPPIVTGKMEDVVFKVGHEIQYPLPDNLFYDCIDGNTKQLTINMFGNDTDVLPKNHWLELKGKKSGNFKIVGFPMNKNQGKHMYSLKAGNTFGLLATYVVKVTVQPDERLSGEPSHKISMTFDADYEKFTNTKVKDLTRSLAQFMFGSADADAITVLDVQPGSVVYSWTNNQLPTDSCPAKQVSETMGKFLNEDGTVNEKAKQEFPYPLNDVEAVPMGACVGNKDFPSSGKIIEPMTPKPDEPGTDKPTSEPTDPGKKEFQEEEENEIWLTTVVPAVVIVVLLIIFLIIACVLYQKKRKGKMSLEDKNYHNNKGAPVIFPDEYDEKPNDASKPLIMDEEKPPMPPPEYTRGSSENSRSSQENHHGEEYEMDTDITSPLYQPPPPVPSGGSNKQPRPHMQPAHRNPAPYVPP
ncbi:dystroglycan 1-like [Saccostrea cucullata]|uniref:dystroglycan 1-like n=1 Tax=Saccostrea cuccullata TaxID=36930 RepID=UPI002ED10BDD